MAQMNTQELSFQNWLHYIKNEASQMSELENGDYIKKFGYSNRPMNINPPKIVRADFQTLLNTNK
jgi:hypothetical protein